MTTFGSERIRDEAVLAARILLVVLFLVFGWASSPITLGRSATWRRPARPYHLSPLSWRLPSSFSSPLRRPWRLDPSARRVAGALYAGDRVYWASLLDHDGHRPLREYDKFLQKRE